MFKYLIFFFLGLNAQAENSYRFEIYGSGVYQQWNKKSAFNPDNRILQIPEITYTLELRPDLQINFTDDHFLVVRSRHFLQSYQYKFENPDQEKESWAKTDSDLSDLFITSNWNQMFSTTIGLQNYQWGPAEIFSPTNPYFHFNDNQRSFFYKEKGRVMVRGNWNPAPQWSVIGIVEPVNNQERYWTADKEFNSRGTLTIEKQFENPINAFALVLGQGDSDKKFIGEYFNWSPTEGNSLYADIKHQFGRSHYVPVSNGFGSYDLEDKDSDRIFNLAVVGYRWEGRVDFRQEFIINDAGYSKREWDRASMAALTLAPNIVQNMRRFSAPGLEFRSQYYSYTSLRIPNLGKAQKTHAAIRWLASLVRSSSALQLNAEYDLGDSSVLSTEVLQFMGERDSEFRLMSDTQVSAGFRWSY